MEQEPGQDPDRDGPDDGMSVFGPWEGLEGALGAAKEREELLSGFAPGGVWDSRPPGPELAAAVARAAGPDWRCAVATGEELVGLLRAMGALQSWAGAGLLGVIRALVRDDGLECPGVPRHGGLPDVGDESLVHEVALALAVSVQSAGNTMQAAWELGARLPGVELLLLRDGTLDLPRARLVAEVFGGGGRPRSTWRGCGCSASSPAPRGDLTQPKPGWHQWTTPRGRVYTQGPKRYPV